MKWFLFFLAIGLIASEKLDRTYLPPPGAQYAGGNPGDIQAPLEPPHSASHGNIPIGQQDFGPQPSSAPITTTTSYAYSQTTTYPSVENYGTTPLPIDSVTGLPVKNLVQPDYQHFNENLPVNTQNQGQLDLKGYNQPGFTSGQYYPGQTDTAGGNIQTHRPIISQHPGIVYSDRLYTQLPYNYPGENMNNNGAVIQIPGGVSQGPVQYSEGPSIPGQQGFVPSNINPQQIITGNVPGAQYSTIEAQGPRSGQVPQGTYSGQPVDNQGYPNYTQLNPDGSRAQQSLSGNQNIILRPSSNLNQPGQDYSTTPVTGSSFTSAHSSISPVNRPERPQAAADRNAVILSYENVRTPNGYSYSYDTSNGIHADETGTVGDGTRAQGSYSYTGDDGKVYTVVYTADENGFRPYGDHIPTAPPIPEAIQKVIEQAARDKEAGIFDDGSYDENKYGDKKYQSSRKHHHPETHSVNKLDNNRLEQTQKELIKPITRITDDEYNINAPQDNFGYITDTSKSPNKYIPNIESQENFKVGTDDDGTSFNDNDNQNMNDHISSGINPVYGGNSSPDTDKKGNVQKTKSGLQSDRNPITDSRVKSTKTEIEDIGDANAGDDYDSEYDYNNVKNTKDDSLKPHGDDQALVISSDIAPVNSKRKQILKQRVKGSRPGSSINKYNKGTTPKPNQEDINDEQSQVFNPTGISNYNRDNAKSQSPNPDQTQQIDENGYYYNNPQTTFQQTKFPTRFKDQESSPDKKPVKEVRPFLTPEVYNQPLKGNQRVYQQSTNKNPTPFMTSRVYNKDTYTDYDDDENGDQDLDDDDFGSTKSPGRPYQPTTSKPENTPSGQRTRVSHNGTVRPQKLDYAITTPGYTHEPTTPRQNSRIGTTESSKRRIRPQKQRQPSTSADRTIKTAVSRPVSSLKAGTSDLTYQERPVSGLVSPADTPSDSTTRTQPSYGFRLPSEQRGSTPQYYTTNTPTSTTIAPSTYQPISGDSVHSGFPETSQPSENDVYETGYQYQPQYVTTTRPENPTSEFNLPTYYQTHQHPAIDTTTRSSIPNTQGNFIFSGNKAPSRLYQPSYQGSTSPVNIPSIVSSTPSVSGSSVNNGLPVTQPSPGGYEYGPQGPIYTTTSASTTGTTPATLIPSTQQPIYSPSQGSFDQYPLVDGFGRPISFEPGYSTNQLPSQYPGTTTVPKGFISGNPSNEDLRPEYAGNNQSPNYPGYFDQAKVIGEDFSGPQQAQSFNSATGYHYK